MKDLKHLHIETERLIIRPFIEADIAPSYEMNLNANVSKYTGDGGVVSLEEIERRITQNVFGDYERYGYGRLAVVWKANNEFIGFTGLKYLEDYQAADLGYRFREAYWGRGIATEAGRASLALGFGELGLDRMIAMAFPTNTASVHVLQKLGFDHAGDIEEFGELVGLYGLSKASYLAAQAG